MFIVFVAWAALQGSLSLWGFRHDAARRDFGAFLHSAQLWRQTGELYDELPRVNLNPPHVSVLLFTPLSFVPFDAAVLFWVVFQISALFAGCALIARELHLGSRRLQWILPAVVASAMTTHNWIEGQVGGLVLLAGAFAWRESRRAHRGRASIALASLISIKPQLGLMAFATSPRITLRVIVVGGAALAAGVLLLGDGVWWTWMSMTQRRGLQLSPWNVSIAAVLHRLDFSSFPLYLALAAFITGTTLWIARKDLDADRKWLLWGLTVLLVGPVSWVYYAAAFLGPLISWGERYRWPFGARIAIVLWLVPLQTAAWIASGAQGWAHTIAGSPYTWGAALMWYSAVASTNHSRAQLSGTIASV